MSEPFKTTSELYKHIESGNPIIREGSKTIVRNKDECKNKQSLIFYPQYWRPYVETKKVKLYAYYFEAGPGLCWYKDGSVNNKNYERVPSEDKEIELPDNYEGWRV